MDSVKVGQIVMYGTYPPVPAIVTHVWNEGCVNLFVFPDGSHLYLGSGPMTSVMRAYNPGDSNLWWPLGE